MNNASQRIMTIDAKQFFLYFRKKRGGNKPFCFNTTRKNLYVAVVKQENMMEECPLFHQFIELINEKDGEGSFANKSNEILFDKLIIVDFGDIFLPDKKNGSKEFYRNSAKDLINNGLDLHFYDKDVHMVPFDKSGNMSRNGRITFIDDKYLEGMNKRLNLGIDFAKIPVVLSKYYAYRGLYLSSSSRVESPEFKITPETLVIIKDQRTYTNTKGEKTPIAGYSYEKDVLIETAEEEVEGSGEWIFKEPEERNLEYVNVPYDGEGFITPTYSKYINKALKISGATSYQIRLPFAKGMLHQVDVHGFIDEYADSSEGEDKYKYEDAFGIERDLKKANIFLTESMFKCKKWLERHCKDNDISDPMQYYCEVLNDYNHRLYISGTNLPYGHTKYTHLSYQVINTLDFTEDQFERVVKQHCDFIEKPVDFVKCIDETRNKNDEMEEGELTYYLPNWKRVLMKNESFSNDIYIRKQLKNTQKGLLTKVVTGKIVVEGQTRYLSRDLLPLLATLLPEHIDISRFYMRYLYQRFYMPMGEGETISSLVELDYEKYYAVFRNPHLSRNEQCVMQPLVATNEKIYDKSRRKTYEKYEKHLKIYEKYFKHLTGIIMFPRGSIAPLCLGGADFDGDLVSIISNQDIVNAVKKGAYEKQGTLNWWKRKISVIKIPSTTKKEEIMPPLIPYYHVFDTFYNRIGQISNAAISIGQWEYGGYKKSTYSSGEPTCAKCTLLTGLEIDAAKNGSHPDLDLILNDDIRMCTYLTFLDKFRKLKAEKNFSYKNMKVERYCKEDRDVIRVTCKGCKNSAIFTVTEGGTYINYLPILFLENYSKLEKQEKETMITPCFMYNQEEKEIFIEHIEKFKKDCKDVIDLFFFYKNIFLKNLQREKNKGYHAIENIETLIEQGYDDENVENILEYKLPILQEKLASYILGNASIEEIRTRINQFQWLLQPKEKRGKVLEKIIGNGFEESILTDDERDILYHFGQHGYKFLWLLIDIIEGPKKETFDGLKNRVAKEKRKYISKELLGLDKKIEEYAKLFYEHNMMDVETSIYKICLETIRKIVDSSIIPVETKIAALYETTERSVDGREFFWDTFSWKELQLYIEKDV